MKKTLIYFKKLNSFWFWIFCFLLLNGATLQAQSEEQNIQISGKVTDNSGEALLGATVSGENSKAAVITDFDGNFSLSLPRSVKRIIVSYIGYKTKTIAIGEQRFFTVLLEEDAQLLSDIVIVGYGQQKKETLTGAISVVKSDALIQSPVANISNALVGRIAGISSTQSSGEPGDDVTTLRIRGVATLNGIDPLVVIDGVESTMATMNALDANEIESTSVLKDASSTAVYGVKGANGVIIVTTKRGVTDKPHINFSYRYGVTQEVSQLKLLNSYQYALYRNEAIQMDNNPANNAYLFSKDELWKFQYNRDYTPEEVALMNISDAQKAQLLNSPALYYSSHDYINEQFGGFSPQEQYNVNISGGTDNMRYFVSAGYFNQDGHFKQAEYRGLSANSTYGRYNLRSNLDIDIHKNLTLSVNLGGQFASKTGILGSSADGDPASSYSRHKAMMVTILANTPFVGPGIVDGNLVTQYINSPLQSKGGSGYSPTTYLLTRDLLTTNTSNFNSIIRLRHRMDYLTKGLSITGTISYDDTYQKGIDTQNNVPTYSMYRDPNNPNEYVFAGGVETSHTVTDNVYRYKWNKLYLEGKADYERNFDKHKVTGMVVANAQRTGDPSLEYQVPSGLMGFASRITYNYDDRYLAEFNMGYNGSENFPPGKRFGFFPAYSLGWIVTNEKFISQNDILTFLKIRGSYGVVGNDRIGGRRFMYLPSTWGYLSQNGTDLGNGYYFGNGNGSTHDPYYAGAYESTIGNPNVTWEKARKANGGLEMNLFKNRLTLSGDLFLEKRDNILVTMQTVPAIVAATLPPANIGKVTNKGYEFQMNWNGKLGSDLHYGIGFNVSYAINKIDYMDEPVYPYSWMNTTGFSIGQYKGFKTDGFYNSLDEASNRPYVTIDGNQVQAGDVRYVDINGDGKIDANDKVPIGYSNLPRYTFGGTLNFGYKGFTLDLLFSGSYKGSMPLTSFYILNPFYMMSGAAFDFQYNGRWTPEKVAAGIQPTFPRASVRTYETVSGAPNDLWIYSTQHLRLKNAEIGYTISNLKKLKTYGLSSVRIFMNGSNLLTFFSKLPAGFDPEQEDNSSNGASLGYLYPPTRSYNLGVNVQF